MIEAALAAREFGTEDQLRFAGWSGDSNPLHMDALAARRTQAGQQVVHGIHLLTWALDQLAAAGLPIGEAARLDVQFTKFVPLGSRVALRVAERADELVRAEISIGDLVVTVVQLRFGERSAPKPLAIPMDAPVRATAGPVVEAPTPGEMEGMAGWIDPSAHTEAVQAAFPAACRALGVDRVQGLFRLSYLVGMICPGLHSIFAAVTLDLVTEPQRERRVGFRVATVREDLGVVRVEVGGCGLSGTVRAMLRKPPVSPPDMDAIIAQVPARRFAGSHALIVGGSRGLGAVAAKMIAAGGGKVTITYARGRADAEEVAKEIWERFGPEKCGLMSLDITGDIADQLGESAGAVTSMYYFATPQIFQQTYEPYSRKRFEEFARFYVDGFYDTCRALLARTRTGRLSVLYPSSIAVESRPAGLVEYAMAKAAGELLCAEMLQALPGIRIVVSRIPRTLTDQTATVARVSNADPLGVLLPVIFEVQEPETRG
jgi:NAD(P)-dependent dehydrogenase (short-subunit alcohol dehydrogenase family)